jgi:hypothetical protein
MTQGNNIFVPRLKKRRLLPGVCILFSELFYLVVVGGDRTSRGCARQQQGMRTAAAGLVYLVGPVVAIIGVVHKI